MCALQQQQLLTASHVDYALRSPMSVGGLSIRSSEAGYISGISLACRGDCDCLGNAALACECLWRGPNLSFRNLGGQVNFQAEPTQGHTQWAPDGPAVHIARVDRLIAEHGMRVAAHQDPLAGTPLRSNASVADVASRRGRGSLLLAAAAPLANIAHGTLALGGASTILTPMLRHNEM